VRDFGVGRGGIRENRFHHIKRNRSTTHGEREIVEKVEKRKKKMKSTTSFYSKEEKKKGKAAAVSAETATKCCPHQHGPRESVAAAIA